VVEASKNKPKSHPSALRVVGFLSDSLRAGDWLGLALAGLLAGVALWLSALPFSRAVQQATIDRFHLVTPSFAAWAIQQPSPPMYNLENRYWFARRELAANELVGDPAEGIETGMLNHFPVRMITFADARVRLFEDQRQGWLYVRSRYQNQERMTVYRIQARQDGGPMVLERMEAP